MQTRIEPEQWDRVVELFYAARDRTGADRRVLLESRCGGNHSLRVVVDQMLRDDEDSGSFLNQPAIDVFAAAVPSPGAQVAPKARFGRYEIVSPIGRGGMGEVWAARDTELGRLVALKFLSPDMAFAYGEHLAREARAASALNHPNIVTVHEVIRHEDTPILVMELVEGDSLRQTCATPQPAERVIQLGQQIARAIAAAHRAGLIHRDIKPENILVRKDGYVKIVDLDWRAALPRAGHDRIAIDRRYTALHVSGARARRIHFSCQRCFFFRPGALRTRYREACVSW